MDTAKLEKLQDVVLFRDLDLEALRLIAGACREVHLPPGRTIIEENSVGDSMWVILEGAVKVYKQDFYGGKEVITTLHEGDHFGELSLFDSAPRSAAVTTIKDTLLLELRGEDLRALMDKDAALAKSIYEALIGELSNRLRESNEHLIYLISED